MVQGLTIVGLGPGNPAQVPEDVLAVMEEADKVYLRTYQHPAKIALERRGIQWESFDYLYEEASTFEEIYKSITSFLLKNVNNYKIVYAVPGHPLVAEKSVSLILEEASKQDIKIKLIPAMSCLDAIYAVLKLDPTKGLTIGDALALTKNDLNPELGLIVTQVYNRQIASDTKLTLMSLYPDEYPVTVIKAAGWPEEECVKTVPLYEIDRITWIDHLTSIYLEPYPKGRNRTIGGLEGIMLRLRGENGCPWDRKQDHLSLKRYLIEETYEVIEAIDSGDMYKLCEELGDLLLQVVFHAQIAKENGEFDLADCIESICNKMKRRHPHVFGNTILKTANDVLERWDKIKAQEKESKGENSPSVLSVPRGLPALLKALKVQEQAARVGFDWPHYQGVISKVYEELKELEEVIKEKPQQRSIEFGDFLFSIVNVARWVGIEPEMALNTTIEKFIKRFNYIEKEVRKDGKNIDDLSLEEMNFLWEKAKKYD
ncbi:MAG: tetrapyrrole methylase family protein / MazG family protein [Clostridia bacterium]|nr:tetrapyrrole methylase family protein / MazG family protein [Clostridia bacterium]